MLPLHAYTTQQTIYNFFFVVTTSKKYKKYCINECALVITTIRGHQQKKSSWHIAFLLCCCAESQSTGWLCAGILMMKGSGLYSQKNFIFGFQANQHVELIRGGRNFFFSLDKFQIRVNGYFGTMCQTAISNLSG